MFFNKRKTNKLENIIYEEARIGTEKLYALLKSNTTWNILNNTAFCVTSFIYHFFFYRIILLEKLNEETISKILGICIQKVISCITTNIKDANRLIDLSNELFDDLNKMTSEMMKCPENERQLYLELRAEYFIANVENIRVRDVHDSISVLYINTYFNSILSDNDLLSKLNL